MREREIRSALTASLHAQHAGEADTLFVPEMGVGRGATRIDYAVINGKFNGYEIKSPFDTLERLPLQSASYSRLFDNVTLVVTGKHLKKARLLIPRWWGILRPFESNSIIGFEVVREAKDNRRQSAEAIVQLLWRHEAAQILKELDAWKGMSARPIAHLWHAISRLLPLDHLKDKTRAALKLRGDWRSAMRPVRDSGSCTTSATLQDSQANLSWLLSIGSQNPLH